MPRRVRRPAGQAFFRIATFVLPVVVFAQGHELQGGRHRGGPHARRGRRARRAARAIALIGQSRGSVKEKVDPFPGVESTQMRPPWRSTMRLQSARPMPVPG